MRRGSKHYTQLTERNQAVVNLIEANPKVQPEHIARELRIQHTAATKRIRRLIRNGVISETLIVDPEYSRFSAKAVVSIKIALTKLRKKQRPGYSDLREFVHFIKSSLPTLPEWSRFFRFRENEGVLIEDAYSIAGGGMGTDVLLLILGTSDALVREFVTDVIGKLSGVDETNTAAIAHESG